MKQQNRARRRFLRILAAGAGAGVLAPGPGIAGAAKGELYQWRGRALGAQSEILLSSFSEAGARRLARLVTGEVARLEKIFSLYRADSELSRLNLGGRIDRPAPEFVELLRKARQISHLTGGVFDVTVQPFWQFHAGGRQPGSAQADVLQLVGEEAIDISERRIEFTRPGMAITLNGIAQGYITDRVVELLRTEGAGQTLVQLGETRAMDRHPDGRPWRLGLSGGFADGQETVSLSDQALATSAPMAPDHGKAVPHLLNPRSGAAGSRFRSLSVVAAEATLADGLSTAFALMEEGDIRSALTMLPRVTVWIDRGHGNQPLV